MSVEIPAKIILSGEHAVVHGCPALAMAIPKHSVTCQVQLDGATARRCGPCRTTKQKLDQKYQAFLSNTLSIESVLSSPEQLIEYIAGDIAETENVADDLAFDIQLNNTIPLGCGLGASASIIVCVYRALLEHLGIAWPEQQLFKHALQAENLQHGHSSGIDIQAVMQNQLIHYQNKTFTPLGQLPWTFELIDTGKPQSSTGECVAHTSKIFNQQPKLLNQFTECTDTMQQAIQKKDFPAFLHCVRRNHQLLCDIGVVPKAVQQHIAAIETEGGAAKIGGAGSIAGDNAGFIIAFKGASHV